MLFAGIINGFCTIIHVPADQPTIQEGINAATDGDTVLLAKGTYNESIIFDGKEIVVGSEFITTGDSLSIEQTIIHGNPGNSVVSIENEETPNAKLIGVTITGGTGKPLSNVPHGGGIYINNASPSLENLIIKNNIASGMGGGVGGGIYLMGSNAIISGCEITDNESTYGGGIRCDGGNISITGCTISDNFAVQSGGGIMFLSASEARVEYSVLTGNSAIYGGTIANNNSNVLINKCTFFHNTGLYGGAIQLEGMASAVIVNTILWKNAMNPANINEIEFGVGFCRADVSHCDIYGGEEGVVGTGTLNWLEGNLNINPQFTDTTSLDLTLPEDSPCVDAGTSLFVINNDTLVNITNYVGTAPDMGAYEFGTPITAISDPLARNDLQLHVIAGASLGEKIVQFILPDAGTVRMQAFDLRGRQTGMLYNGNMASGKQTTTWNTEGYAPGIYVLHLITPSGTASVKVLVQ